MTGEPVFNRTGLAITMVLGVVLAAIFVLLSVFGGDLKPGANGGAHALSPAATGFSGIVTLGAAAGLTTGVAREPRAATAAGLLVLTPEPTTAATEVTELVRARRGEPTLVVLTKWRVVPMTERPTWVERTALSPSDAAVAPVRGLVTGLVLTDGAVVAGTPLRDSDDNAIIVPAPAATRTLAPGSGLDAVLVDDAGRMVMGWQARNNLYILADPDILANHGMRDPRAATAALRLLAAIGGDGAGGIVFDVTLNGFGASRSLIRSAFEPPFVAVTLALVIAGGLAFWYGLQSFGTPVPAPRAISFGKLALVDNVAGLIRMAGREADIGQRYAGLVAATVAARLHAPPGLDPAALAAWLEARRPGYTALAEAAAAARGRDAALAAATALHHWQESTSR